MNKLLLMCFALLLTINVVVAKKVKFSVDMAGQTISANGIHLSGDMQDEAGYPNDWEPNTIELIREGVTAIYSVVLDIPAHRKYEYKFVNGDLFYEVEFVPEESRVGYDFNDNRWVYIDSLLNDTQVVGPLLFGGNAPAGKKLIHFKVDLKNVNAIDANGIHLASTLNNWNYANVKLYSFINKVYEIHAYADSNSVVEYKFVNGNTIANVELVPVACATNGNRTLTISDTKVFDSICFSSCETCTGSNTGIEQITSNTEAHIYPNPAHDFVTISLSNGQKASAVSIMDITGKTVFTMNAKDNNNIIIHTSSFQQGLYFINIETANSTIISKLTIVK